MTTRRFLATENTWPKPSAAGRSICTGDGIGLDRIGLRRSTVDLSPGRSSFLPTLYDSVVKPAVTRVYLFFMKSFHDRYKVSFCFFFLSVSCTDLPNFNNKNFEIKNMTFVDDRCECFLHFPIKIRLYYHKYIILTRSNRVLVADNCSLFIFCSFVRLLCIFFVIKITICLPNKF